MKIALVRPLYHSHLITPPLGIGYISSACKAKNIDAVIIDGLNLDLQPQQIAERCRDYPIVGISLMASYINEAAQLTRLLKETGAKVVIGGPYATVLPRQALEETGADFAVVGEGEETFPELVKSIAAGAQSLPAGVVSARGGGFFKERFFLNDLDAVAFPDWQQMDPRAYKKAPHGGVVKHFPVAPVITSRGCPYECTFCASPRIWKRSIRYRSARNTVDEIEYLVKNFGVREIHFEDDNLTMKKEHAHAICELILARDLRISWATPNGVRADTLDAPLLELMRRSGCYYIAFGIESANSAILQNIKKKTDIESISRAIRLARAAGIVTQGFFIFGLPGETRQSMDETIDFALKSGLDRAQFLLLDVLPGSELWDTLGEKRCVSLREARSYQDVTWLPEGVSREELAAIQAQAFRKFFLRPRQLYGIVKYLKLSQISFAAQRLMDYRIVKKGSRA
jgi:anaerobic magnesium-protoporphyrin IX monomethyl ester cyclase